MVLVSRHVLVGCLLATLAGPCAAQQGPGCGLELKDFAKEGRTAPGWSTWAAREEVQPRCFVDSVHFRSAPTRWPSRETAMPPNTGMGLPRQRHQARRYYRLTGLLRAQSVPDERRQVVARLDWLDAAGKRTTQPDYAYETSVDGNGRG